jgi:integrase
MATIRKHRDKWQVRIRRAGLRPMTKSFSVRKDAMEWGRQMEVHADRAELPADPKALQTVTLGDLVRRYRDTVSIRKKTGPTERIVLNAFLSRSICLKRLSELCTEDFVAYRDQRLKVIKPTSLKRELVPVRHLFRVAKNEWHLPIRSNPLDGLKLGQTDQKRERRLREGEFEKLLDACRGCRNEHMEFIVRFAISTGMRRGEILSIRWKHIDKGNRSLLIPESKTGQSRTIPLSRKALALLGDGKSDDRVFPISPNAVRLSWEHLRARAGLGDLHFHDLRHEAISSFFEMGLTTPEVALISGHKDMRMLFRYSHATRLNILRRLDNANC